MKIGVEKIRLFSQITFLTIFFLLLINNGLERWLLLFALGSLIAFFWGRFYCSWVCPMAALFRPINWVYQKLKINRLSVPTFFQKGIIRVVFLLFFLMMMVGNKVFHLKISLLFYLTIISVLITLVYEERFWHNHICPFGTILSIISKKAGYGLTIDQQRCIDCGICQQSCPVEAIGQEEKMVENNNCILCFNCQQNCPVNAINYKKKEVKKKEKEKLSM